MSSCLILQDKNHYYIGADTACSINIDGRYYRYQDNVQKIFMHGEDIYFCSGNLSIVDSIVSWISTEFYQQKNINIDKLSRMLKKYYPCYHKDVFDAEVVVCRKENNSISVYQLSQYNNYDIVEHRPRNNGVNIICCGYKTETLYNMSMNLLSSGVFDIKTIYKMIFNFIVDNKVGGNITLYHDQKLIMYEKLIEHQIEYVSTYDNLHLVLAECVMAGYLAGCTIRGGQVDIGEGTFVVDESGNVTMNAATIKGYAKNDTLITSINASPEEVAIDSSKISLTGKNIDLTSDNITINSTNFSVTADGQITATKGKIANWTIAANRIYSQNEDGTYNSINTQNGSSFAFAVGAESLNVTTGAPFRVTQAGKLYATDAVISGTITAKDGSIAGYNIGSGGCYNNAIYKRVSSNGVEYEVGMKATSGATDLAFYVKESTDEWATNDTSFYIRNNGQLYCSDADITGKITASSGKIGGWNVGALGSYTQSLYSTYCAADTPSTTNPEYAVFMRSWGGPNNIAMGVKKRTSSSTDWTDADNPFYVRKDGYVLMKDANITGEVHAASGTIDGNLEISGALTHTRGNYKVTLRGVQSDVGKGVFYITDSSSGSDTYPVRINGDGSASFTNVTISGSSTIAAACIPNLSASKITSGTIDVDRLSSSVITTSNFSAKTLSTGYLTIKAGCVIGSATYNAKVQTSGDYSLINVTSPSGDLTCTWWNLVNSALDSSSSSNIKSEIHDFDDRYDLFFDNLKPQLYKYNSRLNEGYSMGYIWQETEDALNASNLARNDVGALYESEAVEGGLGLRKSDFIALNTWQIQKLKARVEELEAKLSALEV